MVSANPPAGQLDGNILAGKLAPDTFSSVLVIPELISTNAYARQCIGRGLPCLLACETQTSGRGRLEHGWLSAPRCSLTFSLVVRLERTNPAGLSLPVATGIAACLARHGCPVGLKWPNDLLAPDGGKLGGILVEVVERATTAIIGIGLNLLPFPALQRHEPTARWVFASTGPLERNCLLADLASAALAEVTRWQQRGWEACRDGWLELCVHQPGDQLLVTVPSGKRERLCFTGIGNRGQLLATDGAGREREVDCGEIGDVAGG